ncbi:MAG: hypothetical protein ACYS76_14115, partial [Planctomycetota bacterium]
MKGPLLTVVWGNGTHPPFVSADEGAGGDLDCHLFGRFNGFPPLNRGFLYWPRLNLAGGYLGGGV